MPATPAYDLHLDQLHDDALALFAQECSPEVAMRARNVLVLRHWETVSHLIDVLAHKARLQRADHDDARQQSIFAVLSAIEKFDVLQIVDRAGLTFRRFLFRRVTSRFRDFLKGDQRRRGRFLIGRNEFDAMLGKAAAATDREWREERDGLFATLAKLTNRDRETFGALIEGRRPAECALAWGVSQHSARRRLAGLVARLRRGMAVSNEACAPNRRRRSLRRG